MQDELESTYPLLKIEIVGINERGHEVSNASMYTGRVLPWLQDVDTNTNNVSDVWYDRWQVTYRDVVILDGANVRTGVFNLTQHDLANSTDYAALRDQLVDAAMANQKPWHNAAAPRDVDVNGLVVPRDVLLVINEINRNGARKLPPPTGTTLPENRYDANGDGFITSNDVLQIINHINTNGNGGEGEGEWSGGNNGTETEAGPATSAGSFLWSLSAPASQSEPFREAIQLSASRVGGEPVWITKEPVTDSNSSSIGVTIGKERSRDMGRDEARSDSLWDQDFLADLLAPI